MKKFVVMLSVFVIALLSIAVVPAFAHEGHDVGDYTIYLGWRNEPAFAGAMNGPEVFLSLKGQPDDAKFPADIKADLKVEAMFGDQKVTIPLEAAYGETGHYIADMIPTMPGDYKFHLTGTVGDTKVDELYDSANGKFSTVEKLSSIMFPANAGGDNTERIAALEAKIADLETRLATLEKK